MNQVTINHHVPNGQPREAWFALINGEIVGHIYMQIEADRRLKFLDAYVEPNHRRKGIYRLLWDTRWEYVNENYKGYVVYAWCKEMSLPLLVEKGFQTGEISTYVEKTIK